MSFGPSPIILILISHICLLKANVSLPCEINKHWAYCSSRSLVQVPSLPADITHLDLSLNLIRQLNEDSFKGLENLVHLDLGWQRRSPLLIKNNAFRGLLNLTSLHLGSNRNIQIKVDAFLGLSNLQVLHLLHCDLNDSLLSDRYLQPLVALKKLDLFGNNINNLRLAKFFKNMTALSSINLTLNPIQSICEADLEPFQGRHIEHLSLASVKFAHMKQMGFNWTKCGNAFKNMSIGSLDLSLTGLSNKRAQLFFSSMEGTKIRHLIIGPNTMGAGFGTSNMVDPDSFTFHSLRFSNISSVDLSMNYISVVKSFVFTALPLLENITLANNKINRIEPKAFLGASQLLEINLSHNLLGELYTHTFAFLPNLQVLDLSNNHIGILQHGTFSGLTNLLTLNLRGNSLSSISNFSPLPSLKRLHLDDNRITTLYGLERISSGLITFTLNTNRLMDLADLYKILVSCPNLTSISMSDNSMSFCSSDISAPVHNKLKEMNLKNNALQLIWGKRKCLDLFDGLGRLSFLSLKSNSLEELPEGLFQGLSSLQALDLSHNSLTHLPMGVFPSSIKVLDLAYNFLSGPDPGLFKSMIAIDLGNNRFLCDCKLKVFQDWAKQTNVTLHTPLSQLYCEFPHQQRGISLSNFDIVGKCGHSKCRCP